MSVVLVGSAKGAPGASLASWGLFHCWPRAVTGVEADVSGGSWALTHGLTCDPGLTDLAAEQGVISEEALERCSVHVGVGKRMVCAPREPIHVRRSLQWLEDRMAAWPEHLDVIVDAGRVDPTTGHPLLARADAIVICTHTTAASLGASAALLEGIQRTVRSDVVVRVITVGDAPYSPAEAIDTLRTFTGPKLDVQLGAALPNDPRLVSVLVGGGRKASRVCSSWFGPLASELSASTAYRSAPTLGNALVTTGGVS